MEDVVGWSTVLPLRTLQHCALGQRPRHQPDPHGRRDEDPHVVGPGGPEEDPPDAHAHGLLVHQFKTNTSGKNPDQKYQTLFLKLWRN